MGAKRQPRYVLSKWINGGKRYLQGVDKAGISMITYHTTEPSMALFFTKYMATKMSADLHGEYEIEPV
jgi:hypothetical protein